MDDNQIIELFYVRNEQALTELAKKYGTLCKHLAGNILHDVRDTEECINDAYLGMWNTIPPQNPNPLVSYLCRIVRNLATNRYHANAARKRNSQYDVALDELENCFPTASSTEDAVHANDTARIINAFLGTMDAQNRMLFVRRYYYADSISDLAAQFGMSNHMVSVRLSRTREKLRKHLIQEGVSI